VNFFDVTKNTARTNTFDSIHNTLIIEYGRITKVLDIQTVVVELIIQPALSKEVYTVTLLNLSSALLEISDYPRVGDTVLLLFLRRHDRAMFIKETITKPDTPGYNAFSGVGILMSTARKTANTVISAFMAGDKPMLAIQSNATVTGTFLSPVAVSFCRAVADSEDEVLVSLLFGEGRPLLETFLARVDREYGFWKDGEEAWVELDAAVTEKYSVYAPITRDIQGAQTTDIGLGKDKAGDEGVPVETDAPVTETVHGKAPVTRDIRSPQTLIVGIGNAESEDPEEERDAPVTETYGSKAPITKDIRGAQSYKIGIGKDGDTEAPVDITLGEKADITLAGKAGVTAEFKKALDLLFEGEAQLVSKKAITVKSDSSEQLEIGNTVATLGAMIDELLQNIIGMKTVGSPGQHVVSPDDIAKFTQLQTKWGQVFKK
jgi:hypothetical protein